MHPRRLGYIFFAIINLALLEAFLFYFDFYLYIILGSIIAILLGMKFLLATKFVTKKYFFFSVTPLLFLMTIYAFLAFTESIFFQQGAVIIAMAFYLVYLENVFLFHYRREKYHQNSIENVSSYINLLTFFLHSISMFALHILVGLPFWFITLSTLLVTSLILVQSFWAAGMTYMRRYLYLAIINLIIVEVFWALSFLPTNFYLSGFLLTLTYYITWGIFKSNLLNILSRKLVVRYITVFAIATLLVVLSANWF